MFKWFFFLYPLSPSCCSFASIFQKYQYHSILFTYFILFFLYSIDIIAHIKYAHIYTHTLTRSQIIVCWCSHKFSCIDKMTTKNQMYVEKKLHCRWNAKCGSVLQNTDAYMSRQRVRIYQFAINVKAHAA